MFALTLYAASRSICFSVLIAFLYAGFTEVIQLFLCGMEGVLTFLLIVWGLLLAFWFCFSGGAAKKILQNKKAIARGKDNA
ncbi:hypothetical protein [Cytobacillus oceanisediminis]|uniref:hypothetical protein n=1 Tax=Cytobacillus oceanisediminis TaxID=665099 RepID=UPI003BB04D47